MRIYVSGPYSSEWEFERNMNVVNAMLVGLKLVRMGHAPFIPHLSHFFDEWVKTMSGAGLPYETYLAWDLALLPMCDALYLIAPSPGANRERELAEKMGIPIYTHIDEIPVAADIPVGVL